MRLRKKQVIAYLEFFNPQDLEALEEMIRKLIKRKMFPPIYKLRLMVPYDNLRPMKSGEILRKEFPLVANESELKGMINEHK